MVPILKKAFPYLAISFCCIAAYFISTDAQNKKLIEKEIRYVSNTASEVYMVWGINYLQIPSKDLWPPGSYEKDSLVYTKMADFNHQFSIKINLPYNTILNYWVVQTRDTNNNLTSNWDAGGGDRKYFTVNFTDEAFWKPGYFIFLAGFVPLLLCYFSNRNKDVTLANEEGCKISEYIPQFDSIRAIAVLLVIVHHWFEGNKWLNFLPNGPIGVNIFFVLSGFLITGILLKAKKQAATGQIKKSTAFRNFYARRTLRIFPIYYLLLIILWILNDPAIKADGVYYFTYTSNYLFYSQQFFPARLSHLWSLAVEEQFYIIWPWLIILVNKKYLSYLISLFIVMGISSNFIFTSKGWWVEIFTPACFDAFAIGGFLSYLMAYQPGAISKLQSNFKWIFGLAFLLFTLDVLNCPFLPHRTNHSLLAIVIIFYCLFKNNNKILNFIFNNKWLIRLGKISYGVYLYHLFVPELWASVIKKFASWHIDLLYNEGMLEQLKPIWLFIQHFSFLMLISVLSWKIIERPVNRLKGFFQNKLPGAA